MKSKIAVIGVLLFLVIATAIRNHFLKQAPETEPRDLSACNAQAEMKPTPFSDAGYPTGQAISQGELVRKSDELAESNSSLATNLQRFKVLYVVDGDTVKLTTLESLRYIGIDTPETKHPRKPVEYYGKEASAFNKHLVEGKDILVEFDVTEKDRYGRLLGYVFLEDGTFVNALLVKQGYAKVYTCPPNVKYSSLFYKLQAEARENNRGLWGKTE